MDYEKAYKEAIKRAKSFRTPDNKDVAAYIFPELSESEDEKTRKELLLDIPKVFPHDKAFRYIAYLEKQGERKHQYKSRPRYVGEENLLGKKISNKKTADNVEPKFKAGDWVVVNDGRIGRIIECTKHFADIDLDFSRLSTRVNNIRSLAIQDAKDGDVLAAHGCLVLFKEIDGLNIRCYCTYHYLNHQAFYVDTLQNKTAFVPATKEQREQLEKAMADAGYTFDFEKKELKKIEQNPSPDVDIPFGAKDSDLQEATYFIPKGFHAEIDGDKVVIKRGEKKSAEWSEEDENLLKLSLENLTELKDRFGEEYGKVGDCIVWQKSIKDRLQSQQQQQWKPSKEHLDALNNMRFAVQRFGPSASLAALDDLYNQLNKLTE